MICIHCLLFLLLCCHVQGCHVALRAPRKDDVNPDKNDETILFQALAHPKNLVALLEMLNLDINVPRMHGSTLLIEAVRNRKLDSVKLLLKHGADATLQDPRGDTALLVAVKNQDAKICVELISSSTNRLELLTCRNHQSESPVSVAVTSKSLRRLELLQCIPFDNELLSYISPMTHTSLLMDAAITGNLTSLLWLIKAGADIDLQNYLKQTVMDLANKHAKDSGVCEVIEFITQHHLQKRLDLQQWSEANTDESRTVLSFLTRPEFNGVCGNLNTALKIAIQHGHVENVQILLQGGADPMAEGTMECARNYASRHRFHLTAVLAKHAVAQYLKLRSSEPEHAFAFNRSGIFGAGGRSRQPNRAEKINAANQLLTLIDRYLQENQYHKIGLAQYLILYRNELSLHELREGRTRQMCVAILGDEDYCHLLGVTEYQFPRLVLKY